VGPLHVYLACCAPVLASRPYFAQSIIWNFSDQFMNFMHSNHLSWTAEVFYEAVEKSLPRASTQAVLLMGILRALWDHDATDNHSSLCIRIPHPTLLLSLRSLPDTYSS